MFTILVVVRKKESVSTEEFRRVWKDEYGPMYRGLPQVKSYKQYHLADRRKDASEDPIDGVAIMSFDSEAEMREAWSTETYKAAAKIRESIMRETAVGVHVASIDEVVKIVGAAVCLLSLRSRRESRHTAEITKHEEVSSRSFFANRICLLLGPK